MKTWTLKQAAAGGRTITRTGLSEAETLEALRDLMYGDFPPAEAAAAPDERVLVPAAA